MTDQPNAPSPPARFKRCIIHIGTEKTGSTAIQTHLERNRRKLLRAGVLYPASAGQVYSSQMEFVAAIIDTPWNTDIGRIFNIDDEAGQAAFRKTLAASLETEFEQAQPAHTLLISCEHFHSRVHSQEAISRLKDFLDQWVEDYEIIVYFRRQDRVALSYQSTQLKSSVDLNGSSISHVLSSMPHYFAYDALYENWAAIFGSSALKARLYLPDNWASGDAVSDFCEVSGLPVPDPSPPTINRSLNRTGFHFLRALNRRFPIMPGDKTDRARQTLVEYIARTHAGQYYPISRQDVKALYKRFDEPNEKLRRRAFPDHPAPLFGDDFSDYPEEAEPAEPDYEEAVELAVKLWRETWHPPSRYKRMTRQVLRWLGRL